MDRDNDRHPCDMLRRDIGKRRYRVREDTADLDGRRKYRLQEPGELGGQFYHLWKTPLAQLGDFGVGMG